MNIGDLKISLLLDNKQFAESIKTSLTMLKMFKQNSNDILNNISPKFKSSDFDKQVSKSEAALKKLRDETKKSEAAINSFASAEDKASVTTTKFAGILSNAGLRFEGLKAIVTVTKNTLGDFFNAYSRFNSSMTGLSSIASFKGFNPEDAKAELMKLEAVKAGLLDIGSASTALKNLLAANFTIEQSIKLIDRLSNSAAFGRQASLSFGQAVSSATEGIKNGNSILVDNAGVTKNLSLMLEDAGFKAQDLMKASQDTSIRMAIFNGIIKETEGQTGDVKKMMEQAAGGVARFDTAMINLKIVFGEFIAKAALPLLEKGVKILEWITNAPPGIQKAALAITILGAAFLVLNNSMGLTPYILLAIVEASVLLPPGLREAAIALGVVTLALKYTNGNLSTLITGLGSLSTTGVTSIKAFAGSIVTNLGPASIAVLALLALAALVSSIIDLYKDLDYWKTRMDSVEKNQTKIDYTPNTGSDATSVPLPTDEKGNIKILSKEEAESLGIYPIETASETKKLSDDINKPKLDSKGKGGNTLSEQVKEVLSRYDQLQKRLREIGKELELNKGYIGATNDLLKEQEKIQDEITYVTTGFDIAKVKSESKALTDQMIKAQSEIINLNEQRYMDDIQAQRKAIEEIHEAKIRSLDDEFEKKMKLLELERAKELSEIDPTLPESLKEEKRRLINKKFDRQSEEVAGERIINGITAGIGLAQQLGAVLGLGADTFGAKLLSWLNQGLALANSFFGFLKILSGGGGGLIGILFGGGDSSGRPAGLLQGSSSRSFLEQLLSKHAPGALLPAGQFQLVQVPYIASMDVKAGKLKLIIDRETSKQGGRIG